MYHYTDHVKRLHKNQAQEVTVDLTLSPSSSTVDSEPVVNILHTSLADDIKEAIRTGVKLACTQGMYVVSLCV